MNKTYVTVTTEDGIVLDRFQILDVLVDKHPESDDDVEFVGSHITNTLTAGRLAHSVRVNK